jgi:plastocyanin
MLFVLAATAVAALALPAPPALAGAGCHGDAPTTGEGDTVEMKDACFTPSTLLVDPGASVTFVNRDVATHNVSAMGWGNFEDMNQDDAFTATFSEDGVYPFACQYHVGMTGAIVVGDGKGAGNGDVVTVASYSQPEMPSEQDVTLAAAEPIETGTTTTGWVAGGAIGLAAGLGIGLLARRVGRTKGSS